MSALQGWVRLPASFAARAPRDLGLDATDVVVDGVEGWLAAGLPLTAGPADVRE